MVYIKAAVTLHNFVIERREILETQRNVVQQVPNVDPRPTDGSLLGYLANHIKSLKLFYLNYFLKAIDWSLFRLIAI